MTVVYVIVSILVLSILVLAHEAGHFWAARLTHMPVKGFNIGFGPKLWSHTGKDGVLYAVRAIPFGGYCAFADTDDEDAVANYYRVPVWKRMVMTLSGPLMNFVLAFVLMVIFCVAGGYPKVVPIVGAITPGSPAEKAGLQLEDKIISVDNTAIGDDVSLISQTIVNANGQPVTVAVERNGQLVMLTMTPEYSDQEKRYLIGITPKTVPDPMPVGRAIGTSFDTCVTVVQELLQFLGGLFHGQGANDIASPIGVVDVMTQAAQQNGMQVFVTIAVFISVNLGLFNLLPIPALDGFKVVTLAIEGIRRKPANPTIEGIITAIGFGALIVLFIFLAGRDIGHLFGWVQGP